MTDQTEACEVHGIHTPHPLRVVPHHIQPLAMGGSDTDDNKVWTCDTGHYNIHRLLDDLLKDGKMRSAGPRGTQKERMYAQQGYNKWLNAGKPGKPVYELRWPEA